MVYSPKPALPYGGEQEPCMVYSPKPALPYGGSSEKDTEALLLAWGSSFSICSKAALVVLNFLTFCLSAKFFMYAPPMTASLCLTPPNCKLLSYSVRLITFPLWQAIIISFNFSAGY